MKYIAKARAGKLGGEARFRIHGALGTVEGRRLGGLRSLATHRLRKTAFKTLREIKKPKHSSQLAEVLGILMGDGHVGKYQVSVVTNSETDYEHACHVKRLLEEIFKLPVSMIRLKNTNAVIILLSSKSTCDFLRTAGMSTGNKTRDQIQAPSWIYQNPRFKRAFLRGLVDTDGCVYFDRHKIKNRDYASICIAFTNASLPLLNFVEQSMRDEGFSPTRWGRHVRLRRRDDVFQYAKRIGFSNPKHAKKIVI